MTTSHSLKAGDFAAEVDAFVQRATAQADAATIAAADRGARVWTGSGSAPIAIGSPEHKQLCCRMFRETFNAYKPSIIDWPQLSPEARERLVNLPIWDIAVQTEGKARLRILSYADSVGDADWREAIALNGWEEGRHKVVLSNLVAAYGIALQPEPAYVTPRDTQWAYLVTGYSECIDSFFAFGLFEVAKRSGLFPPALVDTFEPVIQEEARHILLFANWVAWQRRNLSAWRRVVFELRVFAVWVFLGWERVGIARSLGGAPDEAAGNAPVQKAPDNNFTVTGSKAVADVDLQPMELMAICLAENDRRFAGYDPRLLRPTTMPWMVRLAVRLFGRRPLAAEASA